MRGRTSGYGVSPRSRRVVVAGLCVLLAGCGGDDRRSNPGGGGDTGDGGSADDGCPAGELTLGDGSCRPAGLPEDWTAPGPSRAPTPGIPEGGCGEGFTSDGLGGCDPILPGAPCAGLEMAIPGDTTCRPIATCGSAPWGDIPLGPNTVYVDQAFNGLADGSETNPYPTVVEAVAAAPDGASIAIAAGSYVGSIDVDGKSLAIWGRCPELVELVGNSPGWTIGFVATSNASLHTLSVTGIAAGAIAIDAPGTLLDRIYVHDTPEPGIAVAGTGEVVVADSLVEDTGIMGILSQGNVSVERSEVRGTGAVVNMLGVGAWPQQTEPIALRVETSHIHHTYEVGIVGSSASLEVETTVVTDTDERGGNPGWGIVATDQDGGPASLSLRQTVAARNRGSQVLLLGADATIDALTAEDALEPALGAAHGIEIFDGLHSGESSQATISQTVVRDVLLAGVRADASEVTIDGLLVQRVEPSSVAEFTGYGVLAQWSTTSSRGSDVTIDGSLIEQTRGSGLAFFSAQALVRDTVVRQVRHNDDGLLATGVFATIDQQSDVPSVVTVERAHVEDIQGLGALVVGSEMALTQTWIHHIERVPEQPADESGVGIAALALDSIPSTLSVEGCLVEDNDNRGILTVRSQVNIAGALVRNLPPGPDDNGNGDGRGIELQLSSGTITQSEVSNVASVGLFAPSTELELLSVLVSGVVPSQDGEEGFGLAVSSSGGPPGTATATACRIENTSAAGMLVDGAMLVVDHTLVRDVNPVDGSFGRGLLAQFGADVVATGSRFEDLYEVGLHFIESSGTIDSCHVLGVAPAADDGLLGDGILGASSGPIWILGTRIEKVSRAAISSFGSQLALGDNDLTCNDLPLNVEAYGGFSTELDDLGGNQCGCQTAKPCKAVSTGLSPPEALPDAPADGTP